MPTEIELKLRIPSELIAGRLISDSRVLTYLRDEFEDVPMDARYYDLSNGAFSERKWTFRLRSEAGKAFVTLKTASENKSGLFTRNEWQCLAETPEEGVSALLSIGAPSELNDFIRDAVFVERCRVKFNRRRAILYLPDDARIEMVIDSGAVEAGGKSEALLELELELLFGPVETILELGAYLTEKYGLQKEMISKYERALRLIRSRK